jgi:hypothetical protein
MISFEDNIILDYIKSKTSLPIVSSIDCQTIISCKPKWGMVDKKDIQNIINSYTNNTNKIIYIFLISDSCDQFTIPENIRLYRTSLYKSKQNKNEYLLPYIWEGITKSVPNLEKGTLPIVGFCGLNSKFRKRTLELFTSNKNIKSNFIIRKKFWGGKPHDIKLLSDFENNMISSHFNVCNRGNGNFSIRFYQTLSCGRIPILLNTDIILPFEEEINWKDFIILGDTEEELVTNVLYYWNTKNILEMQIKCKEIYDKYFSNTNFLDKVFQSGKL